MRCIGWGFFLAATLAAAAPQQTRDLGYDLNDRGVDATGRGEFVEAERLLEQAIQYWRPLGPDYDGHVATALFNKAEAQCGQGRWRAAAPNLEEAVALIRKSRGARDLRTLHYQNALANVYLMLGERQKSENLFADALVIEKELYPEDGETAHTMAGLSCLYARAGRLNEALNLAEEALRLVIKFRGENHAETAMLYGNVAQILTLAGRTDRSIPLFRKSRAIYEATLGPNTSRLGLILSQEGLALLKDHKFALAEKNLQEAIRRLSTCAACGFELAVAKNHLAMLRIEQHKYNDADTLLTQAIAIEEEISPKPGSEMAATLEILSRVRQLERKFDDAEQLHSRAQTILGYR